MNSRVLLNNTMLQLVNVSPLVFFLKMQIDTWNLKTLWVCLFVLYYLVISYSQSHDDEIRQLQVGHKVD